MIPLRIRDWLAMFWWALTHPEPKKTGIRAAEERIAAKHARWRAEADARCPSCGRPF